MPDAPFTILIVDDNPNNLFTLKTLLSRLENSAIVEADSGEAALMATVEHDIQLVLLDVQMPGMDGFETARHLQMTARTRDIPIVFLTAVFKAEAFVARGYAIGAVDYLTKPLDENQLLNRIRLYHKLFQRQNYLEAALARLLQSEARYRGYFESNLIGMASAAGDSRWIDVNARLCEILGYPRTQLIGRDWRQFTHADDRAAEQAQLEKILRGETDGYARDQRCVHQDGGTVQVSVSVRGIRTAGGALDHFVLMVQDISERVRARDALIQARHAAEAANRAKSVFIANMSHELRTPLNAILGFSQLMARDTGIPPQAQHNLHIINRSGEHLLGMINDILALAKIESGKMELNPGPFDLPATLQELAEMFQMRAQGKDLAFELDAAANLPRYVDADLGKLRQIVINLLGNAVKFTEQGKVVLRAYRMPDSGEADRVDLILEVADSGPGIPEDMQEAVFKPFVQAGLPKTSLTGSGLGLPISRSFIELMNGEISLESKPGLGSRFRVRLPLKIAGSEQISAAAAPPPEIMGLAPGQPEYRILIAEDHPENREVLSALLNQVGFSVCEAPDGEAAVAAFQSWHPHFIWMDMRMPGLDGFEATRRIRALPEGDAVKIVALTASVFEEEHHEILAAGCDEVARKPYLHHEIFDALARQLGVRYITMQPLGDAAKPGGSNSLSAADLSRLPEKLLQELHAAALALDSEKIAQAAAKIRESDPALADAVLALAGEYHYESLQALCEQIIGPSV